MDIMGRRIAVDDLECLSGSHPKNAWIVGATLLLKYDWLGGWVEGAIPKPVGNVDDRIFQRSVRSSDDFLAHHWRRMYLQTCGIRGHVDARGPRMRPCQFHGA